jgi:GTP-binding protein EngB required for normal cell division
VPTSVAPRSNARRATAVAASSNAARLLSTLRAFADELETLATGHAEIDDAFRAKTRTAVTEIRRRLERDELWVAIVGEFKAGKSTFLNAVLGESLLGTATGEYTGVNTVLRYGSECDYIYETENGRRVRFVDEVPDRRKTLQAAVTQDAERVIELQGRVSRASETAAGCEMRLAQAKESLPQCELALSAAKVTTEQARRAMTEMTTSLSLATSHEYTLATRVPGFLRAAPLWWHLWIWLPRLLVGWFWRRHREEWSQSIELRRGAGEARQRAFAQMDEADARVTDAEDAKLRAQAGLERADAAHASAVRELARLEGLGRDAAAAVKAAEARLNAHILERQRAFREKVRAIAAIDRPGEAVQSLTVWYPSPFLKSGLVLLDTPGINTTQKRFEQRAWEAIERDADACVLLTPVSQALSLETQKALKRMQEYVPHIALVVTKVDKAEKDVFSDDPTEVQAQVEEVMRGAVRGYAQLMGRAEDDVFWVATAAESAIPGACGYTAANHGRFAATIDRLMLALASERVAVIGVRAARLGTTVVQELRREVHRVEDVYTQRIDRLEAERLPDPNAEAWRLSAAHKPKIDRNLVAPKRDHAEAIDQLCTQWLSEVEALIRSHQDKKSLEAMARAQVEQKIAELQGRLDAALRAYLAHASSEVTSIVTTALEDVHQRYQIVARTSDVAVPVQAIQLDGQAFQNDIRAGFTGVLTGHSDENLFVTGGGAAAGAVIGTFLLPGFGTVLGGVLGGIAGSLFGPSLDELKGKLIGNCHAVMEQARLQAREALNAVAQQVRTEGARVLDDSLAAEVLRFAQWIDNLLLDEQRRIDAERRKLADLSERARKIEAGAQEMTRLSAMIAKESALMARRPAAS